MSKQEVRVFPNASIKQDRLDLLSAAATGVADTLEVAGREADFSKVSDDIAYYLSAHEDRAFNAKRRQLDLLAYANNLNRQTNLGSASPNVPTYILTDKDLFGPETNFVFGMTFSGSTQLAIQSVARFVRATQDEDLQLLVTRHVARHEFGHMMGMNSTSDYRQPDRRGGIYEGHCANKCTMKQVMTVHEALDMAAALQDREMAGFCGGCVSSIRRKSTQTT